MNWRVKGEEPSKILAVDDDVSVLSLIRAAFANDQQVEVYTTPSPIYAFELALKLEVRLFIFDFFMPRLTAAVLHTLLVKTYENWRPIARTIPPSLILSGRGDTPELRELLTEPGIAGLIPKPFTPEKLRARALPIINNHIREEMMRSTFMLPNG